MILLASAPLERKDTLSNPQVGEQCVFETHCCEDRAKIPTVSSDATWMWIHHGWCHIQAGIRTALYQGLDAAPSSIQAFKDKEADELYSLAKPSPFPRVHCIGHAISRTIVHTVHEGLLIRRSSRRHIHLFPRLLNWNHLPRRGAT